MVSAGLEVLIFRRRPQSIFWGNGACVEDAEEEERCLRRREPTGGQEEKTFRRPPQKRLIATSLAGPRGMAKQTPIVTFCGRGDNVLTV